MATTADFKNGLCIEFNNDLYTIVNFQHVKPGKGAAFVRTKLKSITTGKVIENTFNAGIKIATVRIERRPHQFLYKDNDGFYFMDTQTFEQICLPSDTVAQAQFLKEEQIVDITFRAATNAVLSCELPPFVNLKVTYAEPAVKGNTVNRTLKHAKLETGAEVQVPLFIEINDTIKVFRNRV